MSNAYNQSDKPAPGQPSDGDASARPAQQSTADGQPGNAGWDHRQGQYGYEAPGRSGAGNGNWYPPRQPEPRDKPRRDWRDVFFGWIRQSDLVRTEDRYVGGVCAGIAHRLGWNPALVRAIAIILAFCGGFGVYAYVFAWLLMPDSADGHIIAEDVLHGGDGWQWVFAPIAMFLVVSAVMSWLMSDGWRWDITGWVSLLALAMVLVMFNATAYRTNRPRPAAPAMPAQGAPTPGDPAARQQAPARPVQAPAYPQYNGYHDMVPPARPAAPAQPRIVRTRRTPAGPLAVLSSFGLVLLSAALMVFWYMSRNHGEPQVVSMVASATGWIGCVCVVLGVLLIVLGARGRRTGGLHPLVWLSAFIAMVMMLTAAATGYCLTDINHHAQGYERVDVNGSMTMTATKSTLKQLSDGVYFVGDSYDGDKVTIDLSDYGERYGTHKMTDIEHDYLSYCPTGTYRIVASDVQVDVKLPRYCTYEFKHPGYMGGDGVGGRYLLYDSGFVQVGFDDGIPIDVASSERGHVVDPQPSASAGSDGKSSDSSKSGSADDTGDDDEDDGDDEDYDDFTDDVVSTSELTIDASTIQGQVGVTYGGNGKGYVRISSDNTKKEGTK